MTNHTSSLPTNESILFDLDNTLYDQTGSWNSGVTTRYPNITMVTHPMSVSLMAKGLTLPACASLKRVFDVGYHLDEAILGDAVRSVREVAERADVWFVSMACGSYNAPTSEYEKQVQLLRDFGTLGEKAIFSGNKHEISGRLMVDDHPELAQQEKIAPWRGVTVRQAYTCGRECELSVDIGDYATVDKM